MAAVTQLLRRETIMLWLKPTLVVVLTIVAFAWCGRSLYQWFRLLKQCKPFAFTLPTVGQAITDLLILVIGQKKVLSWLFSGLLHVMIFWGFIALFTTIVEMYGEAFQPHFVFPLIGGTFAMAFCQDFFTVLVLIGVGMALYLRQIVKPKRFEGSDHVDAIVILFCISGIMISLMFMHAWRVEQGFAYAQGFFASKWIAVWLPTSTLAIAVEVSYWIHLGLILFFLNWLPYGKHLHLITIIPNILLRKRSVRGRLKPLNLEDETIETFGANQWPDFPAKDMLDTFACMECGRCVAMCPANNTGKELNPKKLHTAVRYAVQSQAQELLAGKTVWPQLAGDIFSDDFFWQCTTCGACVEECPATNEHIDKIMEVRRHMVLTEGKLRPEVKQTMKSLEAQFNPFSLSHGDRFAWAKDLSLPFMEDHPEAEYIYWVGCFGCFDQRNIKVSRAIVKILQKAGVSFGVLKDEQCTGDPARRMGNEDLYQTMAKKNIEYLNTFKGKKIITQCPHCFNTIKNEYCDFGGNFEVIHHTELIEQLLQAKKLPLTKPINLRLAYHDSCYLGRHNGIYEPPRNILRQLKGATVLEIAEHGSKSFCCGGGGARMFMEEKEGKRVSVERVEQAARVKPDLLVSNCPYCLSMFEDGIKSANLPSPLQPKDIAELVAEAME